MADDGKRPCGAGRWFVIPEDMFTLGEVQEGETAGLRRSRGWWFESSQGKHI